jgi:hypothetical protein
MRKSVKPLIWMLIFTVAACGDKLDIRQNDSFSIKTLPVPKRLQNGEIVPIEFTIIKEGSYTKTRYAFRYFQSDGDGILMDSSGVPFAVNRFYKLDKLLFTLLYRSECTETQTLDFVFTDNFGNKVEYTVVFQNEDKS